MPSFLSTVSKAARTAYPVIQRAVREGLSYRAIQSAIREELGRGISNTVLGQLIQRERGLVAYGVNIEGMRDDRRLNINRLPEALTRQRKLASFVVELEGIDANGRKAIRRVTVSSDEALTPNEIRDLAEEASEFGNREGSGLEEITGSVIISGTRLGALGRL